jgi:hypothetical protein
MSTDKRYDRGFSHLTSDYCRMRIDMLDDQLKDPRNKRRTDFLEEQVNWWRGQLEFTLRREIRQAEPVSTRDLTLR